MSGREKQRRYGKGDSGERGRNRGSMERRAARNGDTLVGKER